MSDSETGSPLSAWKMAIKLKLFLAVDELLL